MSDENSQALSDRPDAGTLGLPAFTDLKIVELGSWLAAPSTGAMFADLGAQVIKIEPASGDPLRNFPASMRGGNEKSPGFSLLNRHKKSLVMDITQEQDLRELGALLATADVFITNMRSGALERAELDPPSLTRRFPKLIYASLTGLGLAGPDSHLPGFDTGAFWARSGMLNQVTAEGSDPIALVGGYGDLMTSLSMFSATLVALLARVATGRGGIAETSLLQTGAWLLSGDVVAQAAFGRAPKSRPRAKSRTPLVNSYKTADGRWFFLTGVEAGRHFESVCRAIDRPTLAQDPRFHDARALQENAAELIRLLDEAFATLTLAEWEKRFTAAGVWWQKVATPAEVMQDPQVIANQMAHDIEWGDSAIRAVTLPFGVFGRHSSTPSVAPELGEHHGGFRAVPPSAGR